MEVTRQYLITSSLITSSWAGECKTA